MFKYNHINSHVHLHDDHDVHVQGFLGVHYGDHDGVHLEIVLLCDQLHLHGLVHDPIRSK